MRGGPQAAKQRGGQWGINFKTRVTSHWSRTADSCQLLLRLQLLLSETLDNEIAFQLGKLVNDERAV